MIEQNSIDASVNNKLKDEGGYVFISHAHNDIHEIRKIRNFLEENGLEPICFYLRCLTDDNEIVDLIKREIDARQWFLLVDSENARQSKWVQTELKYIQAKDSKKLVKVSLDEKEKILPVLNRLTESMKVFLSYSHYDLDIARKVYESCLEQDYKVFFDIEDIGAGADFVKQIHGAIDESSRKGCVVIILSENSLRSQWLKSELMHAVDQEASILAILADDVELPPEYQIMLNMHPHYHLKRPITDEQMKDIVELIGQLAMKKLFPDDKNSL